MWSSSFVQERGGKEDVEWGRGMGFDPILWNYVGSRSYELKKNLDKTTETELICHPPLRGIERYRPKEKGSEMRSCAKEPYKRDDIRNALLCKRATQKRWYSKCALVQKSHTKEMIFEMRSCAKEPYKRDDIRNALLCKRAIQKRWYSKCEKIRQQRDCTVYERWGAGVEYHFQEFNEPHAPS